MRQLAHRGLPLAALAAVAPVLAVPAPQALVVVLAVAGLWAAVQAAMARSPICDRQVMICAAVLAGLAALTAFWSIDAKAAVATALRTGALALPAACLLRAARELEPQGRRWIAWGLAIGLVLAGLLLLAEYVGPQVVGRLVHRDLLLGKSVANRSTSLVVMLMCPAFLALARSASLKVAAAVAAVAIAGVLASDNSTAQLALVVALAMAGLVRNLGPRLIAPTRMLVVAAVLAASLMTLAIPDPQRSYEQWGWKHTSLHHRLTIWRFVGARIAEHPLRGWGMDAARVLPGADDKVVIVAAGGSRRLSEQVLPLHPHNAVLQVWLELGLGGALAMAAVLWMLLGKTLSPPDRKSAAAATATLAAAVLIACSSYGLWQGWWQAALWIAAVLVAATTCRPEKT
ncbi:MAG TPA: O-antigen ligase family protein [Magnetospirillum sp.]|jgi:O-antigen ligase|nr:O-antigen ligase family protein [Magnetospirillum sp.]